MINQQKIILATFGSCLLVLSVISTFFFNQGPLLGFYLLSLAIGSIILFTINKQYKKQIIKPSKQKIDKQTKLLVNIRKLLFLTLLLNTAYVFLTTFLSTGIFGKAIPGDVGLMVFIIQLIIIPILLALIILTWKVMNKKEKIMYLTWTLIASTFIITLISILTKYS